MVRVFKNTARTHEQGKAVSVHPEPMTPDQKAQLLTLRQQTAQQAYATYVKVGQAQDPAEVPAPAVAHRLVPAVRQALTGLHKPHMWDDPASYQAVLARATQAAAAGDNFLLKYVPLLEWGHCMGNPLADKTISFSDTFPVADLAVMLRYMQMPQIAGFILALSLTLPNTPLNQLVRTDFIAISGNIFLFGMADGTRSLPFGVVEMLMGMDMLLRRDNSPHPLIEYGITAELARAYMVEMFDNRFNPQTAAFVGKLRR
jgi:hypothetical protein